MRSMVSIVSLLLAAVCCSPGLYALSEVHIDLQPAGAATASGYVAVTNVNRWDNSTAVDVGNGVRAAWLDFFQGGATDRGGTTSELTRDFLNWNSSAPAETFRVTGLQPGSYDLKIYSTDPSFPDKQTSFAIDVNNDSIADTTITIKNNLSEHDKTVAVAISAAGILQITIDGIGGATGAINGLDLVSGAPDTVAPAAITTLAVTGQNTTQIMLRWTAPADDLGAGGPAGSYDVRYCTSTINEANWARQARRRGNRLRRVRVRSRPLPSAACRPVRPTSSRSSPQTPTATRRPFRTRPKAQRRHPTRPRLLAWPIWLPSASMPIA